MIDLYLYLYMTNQFLVDSGHFRVVDIEETMGDISVSVLVEHSVGVET